jgi:alpha-tubulin suppressor-like RCC1 family protein
MPVGADYELVSAGGRNEHAHTCGVRTTFGPMARTELRCWGSAEEGEVGTGDVGGSVPIPTVTASTVMGDPAYQQVAAGGSHTCALDDAGALWCWGRNVHGQVGNGMIAAVDAPVTRPVRAVSDDTYRELCAGESHACALTEGGSVHCWGFNDDGQLGRGANREDGTAPAPVELSIANEGFVAVACGRFFSCALHGDGAAWCWGLPSSALGRGVAPDASPGVVGGDRRWAAISCGHEVCCAIEADVAALWCWGENGSGQVGIGDAGTSQDTPRLVARGTRWKAVEVGTDHVCGVRVDDSLWCWGDNAVGQLGVGSLQQTVAQRRVCLRSGA